jgi:glutamate synthase (NADPH/NADH) small chain
MNWVKLDEMMQDPLGELLPPLSGHEAAVEANRCLYCFDAPCTQACPTHIDIPKFIKKIATGNLAGSARTILESNLLGATCARVCPVQELCEGSCVLGIDHMPISIGRLQRHAIDAAGTASVKAGSPTGKRVAVVGAGAAGLSCAGELRRRGHEVVVFDKRPMPGGLSTYGIIKLREPIEIALAEAAMIEKLGAKFEYGKELGENLNLDELTREFDAVFLGLGLGRSPSMGIPGEELIEDGLVMIETSKTAPQELKVGRQVVVIGAGNTAIDCATIAKRLGAESVTMVYRRSDKEMTAYDHEVDFVRLEGVGIKFLAQPTKVLQEDGKVTGLQCVGVRLGEIDSSGRPMPEPIPDSDFVLPADQIVKAIGQEKPSVAEQLGIETMAGYLKVDENLQTNVQGVFAGGDCIRVKGSASTVMAVQDGKLAAQAIHRHLMGGAQ